MCGRSVQTVWPKKAEERRKTVRGGGHHQCPSAVHYLDDEVFGADFARHSFGSM